ncbi:MAG: alpha/beta fold hydrolase [Sedimentisphaerales bacterium]|jgi:alpha-beta hydrolase superfamily lysophospholipase
MLNSRFDTIENYLKFYGLNIAAAAHEFVQFKSNGFELAGHIFIPLETGRSQRPTGVNDALSLTGLRPKEYRATVILIHGYLNHCGLLSKLIKYLVEAGFAVAVFDLPGHGLSSGEPTAIDDFSQYSDSLNDFMKIIRPKLNGQYHIIGHSTGAAVILEYLLACTERSRSDFDKVILAAPLERTDWWLLEKIGFSISRLFSSFVPRVFRKVSSDKDFLRFIKYKDPLQAKKISLKWVAAMFKWDQRIADAKISNRPVFVIQGLKDNIINWRHNIRFIQSKFSNTQVKLVEKCRHELFNESEEIRTMVFSQIKDYLEKQAIRPEE